MAAEFALAANVIATISFTIQLWSESSQIRKRGSTISAQDCSRNVSSLQLYCNNIRTLQGAEHSPDLQEAARVRDIADEVSGYATTLADRLAKCQLPADQDGWKRYQGLFSVLWHSMRLDADAQMERLATLRLELQSELMVSMSTKINLSDLKQRKDFQQLDTDIKALTEATLEDQGLVRKAAKALDDVLTLGQQRHEEVMAELRRREAVEMAGLPMEESEELRRRQMGNRIEELKNLLWFTGIERRYGAIATAHKTTFEWIFTGQRKTAGSNTTFLEWMKEDNGVYWVSGRAGAGKSSLMRFLYDDPRTKVAFQTWAGDRPLVLASFYFWNSEAADDRLKSLTGLYRAVLLSLIRQDDTFAELLFPDHLVEGRKWNASFPSLLDMAQAFGRLAKADRVPAAIGLIIDGLDEYEATQREQIAAAEMLCQASKSPNMKIVISSRPEIVFETAFRNSKRLLLHKLTRSDRRTYVSNMLETAPRLQAIASKQDQEELFDLVVERSEGIFLWVRLAVATLLEEVGVAMDISKLKTVTGEIPSGSEELSQTFDHMLRHRIPPQYRQVGLRLIETTRYGYTLPHMMIPGVEWPPPPHIATAVLYSFFEADTIAAMRRPIKQLTQAEIATRTELAENMVRRSCAGLLELRATPPITKADNSVIVKEFNDPEVHFLHKDVAIYLRQETTRHFFESTLSTKGVCIQTNLLKCMLMMMKSHKGRECTEERIDRWVMWVYVEQCMRIARDTSETDVGVVVNILNDMDQTMKRLFNSRALGVTSLALPDPHWTAGFPVDPLHEQESMAEIRLARPNFLSFAIEQDVFCYVDWALRAKGLNTLTKDGKPLLASACGAEPFWRVIPLAQPARMVKLLLDHGADPNESFNGVSCWESALKAARRSESLADLQLSQLAESFALLLRAGANPHAIVKWTEQARLSKRNSMTNAYERTAYEQIRRTFVQTEARHTTYHLAPWSEEERKQIVEKGHGLLILTEDLMKQGHGGSSGLQERTKQDHRGSSGLEEPVEQEYRGSRGLREGTQQDHEGFGELQERTRLSLRLSWARLKERFS